MAPTSSEGLPYRVPCETYLELAATEPAMKRAIVLRLIRIHPRCVLELPVSEGMEANLRGADLSQHTPNVGTCRDVGQENVSQSIQPLPTLRRAVLHGADLESVNLQGTEIGEADLRDAVIRKGNLRGARLERANLMGADLAGACLQGAMLGEADLRGVKLEDADLQGASLRFADLRGAILEGANLVQADLWGTNLEGAVLTNANLRTATLNDANLQKTDLAGANLQGAELGKADLRGANLRGAELVRAQMRGAKLQGAILAEASLQGISLAECDLSNVHLSGAWLEKTQCAQDQFGGAIGEELVGDFTAAAKGYLALERNFTGLGDKEAASWAYRKRRRMEKRAALANARKALGQCDWWTAACWSGRYAADQFVEWLCDYGESVPRVLAVLFLLYLLFAVLYGMTGSVVRVQDTPAGIVRTPTSNPTDLAIFSLLAMTTSGSPTVGLLPSSELVHLLTGLQALVGIALTGLLGFVVGNRIRR